MTELAFEVEGLTVAYLTPTGDQNVVVWNFGMRLAKGEVLGLAGESGCGKSTAALASLGYRPAKSRTLGGTARLGQLDLLALPERELWNVWGRKVAYVAQNAATALNPALSIGRQMAHPIRRHLKLRGAELHHRQLELLESVAMPDPERALRRFPHEFSGGQQQRIAIAIAMSCEPDVLVLDEPTTGLDVTTQARVTKLLRKVIADTGVATLFVSHDLALLAEVTDRLVVMYAGESVEEGPTRVVVRAPRHPYTSALLAAAPSVQSPRSLVGIAGQPPESVQLDSCSFAPRCHAATEMCLQGHGDLVDLDGGRRVRCRRVHEVVSKLTRPVQLVERGEAVAEPLLEVVDLACEYRGATAPVVLDVSFGVRPSETFGIVGESGSGKSTLLRAIAGLHEPSSGTVLFEGIPLVFPATRRTREMRRKIQLVFQNPDSSLNPRHTVLSLLERPIKLLRDDISGDAIREAARELLEAVRLPRAVLHRYPAELSGGQKQRVALAGPSVCAHLSSSATR